MSINKIKIFYSWQSDLPGKDSRNIIHNSIQDAVKSLKDVVDIEADRDTKGKFGSPDIAQTILSKIDECDIFIADVSIVHKYETKDGKIKCTPNPNVMLELGYAINVVTWDNIICILNTDYGSVENMPFDISHHRLTPFSLKNEEGPDGAKKMIKGIIEDTVQNILKNGKRVKAGFPNLCLGCYADGFLKNKLIPYPISQSQKFISEKEKIIKECRVLFEEIKNTHLPEGETKEKIDMSLASATSLEAIIKKQFEYHKLTISDNNKNFMIELIQEYLDEDITLQSDFFSFGNLMEKNPIILYSSYETTGTPQEEEKYNKFLMFEYKLNQLKTWDTFILEFSNYILIPLAISNDSNIVDEEIDIFLTIDRKQVEIINPLEKLITPNITSSIEQIMEDNLLKNLLMMTQSAEIVYDTDISYNVLDFSPKMSLHGQPKYDIKDYQREISKYIANTDEENDSEFTFHINSLRAHETKWLGAALLLKPLTKDFEITYSIKSRHSDGHLSGVLKYEK